MDTLTHIVLGACIGEAIAGKQLGKKAMVLGAIAQSLPDIDFVASFWLPTSADLLAHRGFTHSFLFAILVTPLLSLLSARVFKSAQMHTARWMALWGVQIGIHIFIDAFNVYGTGWFEPFSHYRVSFNTMYVADPLFSIWPAITFAALLILSTKSSKRSMWVKAALGLSACYLLLGVLFKLTIDHTVTKELADQKIAAKRVFTTPTLLNNVLWYTVAETDTGYYIGYRSLLDKTPHINFHFAPKNDSLLRLTDNKKDIDDLTRFSNGYYTITRWHDTILFNDLRFGEILGWQEPDPKFVFYYFLQYPDDNLVIVQRGRFARWDKNTLAGFLKRIKGI